MGEFRRPRVPEELAKRIDVERGDVPFDRWVRRALESALGAMSAEEERDALAEIAFEANEREKKVEIALEAREAMRKRSKGGTMFCADHLNAKPEKQGRGWFCGEPGCPRRLG